MTTPTPRCLTPGQARVLTEIARGGRYEAVAARLGISKPTVLAHMADARRRIGATSTVHLLALAIACGDIDPDCADGTATTTRS